MNQEQKIIISFLRSQKKAVSSREIYENIFFNGSVKTLVRRLEELYNSGAIRKHGNNKYRKYQYEKEFCTMKFLKDIPEYRRQDLLNQIKELWTCDSNSIEGNTISLGETKQILEYGLTISGKSLKEHNEVLGHAKALDVLFDLIQEDRKIVPEDLKKLHAVIMNEQSNDYLNTPGQWKTNPNGTYIVLGNSKPEYVYYAYPIHVERLVYEYLEFINQIDAREVNMESAPEIYARAHVGLSQIHPFHDGNGRMSRLIANIPLLKAGLPPIVISRDQKKEYLDILMEYTLKTGVLTNQTGVFPDNQESDYLIDRLGLLCEKLYLSTVELVNDARSDAIENDFSFS